MIFYDSLAKIPQNVLLSCIKGPNLKICLSKKAYKLGTDLQQICSPVLCFRWLLLLDTSVEAVLPGASYNELCCLDRKGINELLTCEYNQE